MQISTNRYYDRSNSQFQALQAQVDKLQEQISSGKKVAAPSDDAVGYQRLTSLNQAGVDDTAWGSNITLAHTIIQQADSTLGSITDRLQQVQELTVQASNGTLSASDRATLAGNVRAALQDLVGLANTTDVRGQPLFGSATGTTAVTQDSSGNVSFVGSGSPSGIPIGNNVSIQPSDTATRIFGNVPTQSGTTDVFALLNNLATALESGAPVPAGALDSLNAAVTQVTDVRSAAGARSARLDLEQTRLKDTATTRASEQSALQDTDITAAITELQKTSTVLQATQASFTKLSQLSLFNYLH
ncbi:flagellar hook-associated protein FlgL [Sphingomonas sp. GlSt437]|uniref:flagellar hook-associated protein FlgL n=2 Tax=Bacteria TaxID=2 RepID=UPI003A8A81EF